MRTVGTVSRGVRCPVVKEGDDLIRIVTEAIADMGKEEHITFHGSCNRGRSGQDPGQLCQYR